MKELTKRVEQVEKDTHQIRIDVATLTERSKNFATTTSVEALLERCDSFATRVAVEKLTERCEHFVTKGEFTSALHQMEVRLTEKLDGLGLRINGVESKIFWGIFLPAMSAVVAWFVKTTVLQM